MEITRNSLETGRGPAARLTGSVYIDPIAPPSGGSRIGAASVRFTPARRRPGS